MMASSFGGGGVRSRQAPMTFPPMML